MKKRALFAALPICLLVGCGPSFDGPDEGEITAMLQMEMEEGIGIDDIDIIAVQTVGDELEPRYRTRSDVNLVLEEDFVQLVRYIDDRPVVKVVAKSGTKLPAILFTQAEPIGDDWGINIEKVDIKRRRGVPISQYENYIIEGSGEEKAAEAAAKKKQAEMERVAQQKKEDARASFFGTWKSSRPVMRPGNVTWQDKGENLTIEVALNPGKDGAGTGTMTVKSLANAANSSTGPISYVISDGENTAVISVPNEIRLPGEGSWIDEGDWTLYRSGRLEVTRNNRWNVQLNAPN